MCAAVTAAAIASNANAQDVPRGSAARVWAGSAVRPGYQAKLVDAHGDTIVIRDGVGPVERSVARADFTRLEIQVRHPIPPGRVKKATAIGFAAGFLVGAAGALAAVGGAENDYPGLTVAGASLAGFTLAGTIAGNAIGKRGPIAWISVDPRTLRVMP